MQRSGLDRRSTVGAWVGNLPGPLAALARFSITRYLIASVVSLAFDVACFLALVALTMQPSWASAAGYTLGILVHWLISSSFVFPGKKKHGSALHLQRAMFAGSAIIGLGITVGIVALATGAGFAALPAKIAAVAVSFVAVYAIRKWGIFK